MTATGTVADWEGPGVPGRARPGFRWSALLWALIYPRRGQHMAPTVSGALLIALSLGIGTAAYNSSSNILFITLALLLACLILSGVLSWLNFSRVRWRLLLPPAARAGQATTITLELSNTKRLLPTYGLECTIGATAVAKAGPLRPESTFTARGLDVRAILRQQPEEAHGRLRLPARLDPQEAVPLDWSWVPPTRGRWKLEVQSVGSLFPFGFFHKKLRAAVQRDLIVWPAPVAYRRRAEAGARWLSGTERTARPGSGSDLLALRRYAPGDSHRLIHWKASARTGQLLVRQFAAESVEGYTVWVQADVLRWPRAGQFERLVGFCATLAEDLFRSGQLRAMAIDDSPVLPVRQVRELEAMLDRLAVLEPQDLAGRPAAGLTPKAKRNLLTFAPDGEAGVVALIDGAQAATA
ncbi:MAG: DUF58 domain-containing protein [Opitutales bacterium]